MSQLLQITLACLSISFCVFVALFPLYLKKEVLVRLKLFLVSLSAGALIGGAFLHLLPKASEKIDAETLFLLTLSAFVFFFFMEKLLYWRHCHQDHCPIHTFGYMNLFGDSLHNFIDGLVIASSFSVSWQLGITTTLAVALHEIPQEIGDFGVLIHAGFNKKKALAWNYLVALTVVLGGITGYFLLSCTEKLIPYLLPFAAGGFIYIASSDLMPEIRKEKVLAKSIGNFLIFIMGIFLMFLIKFIFHHH